MKKFCGRLGGGLAVIAMVSGFSPASFAEDPTSERIKGVSEFILERANDNYIYILTKNIEDNKTFEQYFPNTYRAAVDGKENFKLVLTNKKLWENAVREDLESFSENIKIDWVNSSLKSELISAYITAIKNMDLKYKGKEYPLTVMPIDATEDVRNQINQFYNEAQYSLDDINSINATNIKEKIDSAKTHIKKQASIFYKQRANLVYKSGNTDIDNQLNNILDILNSISVISDSKRSYLEKTMAAEKVMHEYFVQDAESKDYLRFKHYIYSFAALADADTVDGAKAAMQALTLPPVSFGLKRANEENNVFVSAYFGVSGGIEKRQKDNNATYSGLFAPVGIEYSRGYQRGSLSLMAAPFDLAYPINLELENKDQKVTMKDIVRPGVYVSYGMKEYPLSFGFGASRGTALRSESTNETMFSVFVVIDMPLFQLF